ncbi:hypothetical protein [Nostoc sp. FACHB-190]|uniref:hypothetical protein n=1 Tax=Nostoc sp. FACHB-190 TaxID=2692838 RepID=UPI001687504A|nr:hypothetical protein [Nostoc sp. FACHB-190]
MATRTSLIHHSYQYLMTPEKLLELVDIAIQVATRRNRAITVFKFNNTYYMVDAYEWENGRPYGQDIITVEPAKY